MSGLSITLSPKLSRVLRERGYCWADQDDTNREVLLYVEGHRPDDVYQGALAVELSPADLDLIDSPDGLTVADETRTTGWLVRVTS